MAAISDSEVINRVISWFTERMEMEGADGCVLKTPLWRKCRAMKWQDVYGRTPLHIAATESNMAFLTKIRQQNMMEEDAWLPWTMLDQVDADFMVKYFN